jgi:hypothetical protein
MNEIQILIDEPKSPKGGKLGPGGGNKSSVASVATEKLQASLNHLTQQLRTMLKDIREVGDYELKEIELQAEISADGFVLVGKAGVKGAVTLKFSAKEPKE